MKSKTALATLAIGLLAGFGPTTRSPAATGSDAAFARMSDEFLDGYLAWRPLAATSLGLHEYDGRITDYRRASIDAELARLTHFEMEVASFHPKSLGPETRFDRELLLAGIRNELFH